MSDTTTPAPAPPTDGRVPIVIGVTGHRNVASDDPALRAAVERELKALAARYRNTPFLVLSGLAEGFDRLAANRPRRAARMPADRGAADAACGL